MYEQSDRSFVNVLKDLNQYKQDLKLDNYVVEKYKDKSNLIQDSWEMRIQNIEQKLGIMEQVQHQIKKLEYRIDSFQLDFKNQNQNSQDLPLNRFQQCEFETLNSKINQKITQLQQNLDEQKRVNSLSTRKIVEELVGPSLRDMGEVIKSQAMETEDLKGKIDLIMKQFKRDFDDKISQIKQPLSNQDVRQISQIRQYQACNPLSNEIYNVKILPINNVDNNFIDQSIQKSTNQAFEKSQHSIHYDYQPQQQIQTRSKSSSHTNQENQIYSQFSNNDYNMAKRKIDEEIARRLQQENEKRIALIQSTLDKSQDNSKQKINTMSTSKSKGNEVQNRLNLERKVKQQKISQLQNQNTQQIK